MGDFSYNAAYLHVLTVFQTQSIVTVCGAGVFV